MRQGHDMSRPCRWPNRDGGKCWSRACSELAGLLSGPAFDNDLGFGVELDRIFALGMKNAEETFLPAVEREIGHGGGDADVDADVAGGRFVAEFAGRRAASREERSLIAIGALADKFDGLINVVRVNEAEDRAEDFGMCEGAGARHAVENGRLQEIAIFVAGNFGVAPIHDRLGTFAHTGGDERFDALLAIAADNWAHLNAGIEAKANLDGGGRFGDGVAECFLRFADRDGNRYREATLAGAPERGVADDLLGEVHVRIGKYDDVVLRAALALHALAACRRTLVDVLGHGRGADKTDRAHRGMIAKRVHDFPAAVDQVDDALGDACFFDDFY